jgi:YVTN family beta-propeller protein
MMKRFLAAMIIPLFLGMGLIRAAEYQGPIDVISSQDGKSLYVLEHDSAELAILRVSDGEILEQIPLKAKPNGMVLSPDGKVLYITCGYYGGHVAIVPLDAKKVAETLPAGHTPCGPSISPDGKTLYVCNQFNDNVVIYDLAAKKQVAEVPCDREPVDSAITPDGSKLFVANLLPNDPADSFDVASEVTVIDTKGRTAKNVRLPNGASSLHGICVSADGKYAYVTGILARYQMPTTQLERGWMNTNSLSILDAETGEFVNTVLLDDVDLGAANPYEVKTSKDAKTIFVTHYGTHELTVIDAVGMHEKLAKLPKTIEEAKEAGTYDDRGAYSSATIEDVPNDLAFLVGLKKRIKLNGNSPRGFAVLGRQVFIAMYFADTLDVVNLDAPEGAQVKTIALGPDPKMTPERIGERNFHDAALCFQQWQSCTSCHPNARVDALNWDLMNDGLGNPKNAKSMLLAHKTPPAMISGVRGDAETAVRAGIRHIQFAVRPEEDAQAIDAYLMALEPLKSPYLVDGKLSEAAQRGKKLFESEEVGCAQCHPAPLYTDLQLHDVGSRGPFDRRDTFDTPTLIEVWRTAPYMHDGRYVEMKEVFVEGKHGDVLGDIEGLTDQQINDLVEYVLSL